MKRRRTANKEKILHLLKCHHILSVPEIKEKLPEMDPSTIYRNIKRFKKDGLIKEVGLGIGTAKYELSHYDHYHFVCNECDQVAVIDISQDQLRTLLPLCGQIDNIHLHVEGQCEKCNH